MLAPPDFFQKTIKLKVVVSWKTMFAIVVWVYHFCHCEIAIIIDDWPPEKQSNIFLTLHIP